MLLTNLTELTETLKPVLNRKYWPEMGRGTSGPLYCVVFILILTPTVLFRTFGAFSDRRDYNVSHPIHSLKLRNSPVLPASGRRVLGLVITLGVPVCGLAFGQVTNQRLRFRIRTKRARLVFAAIVTAGGGGPNAGLHSHSRGRKCKNQRFPDFKVQKTVISRGPRLICLRGPEKILDFCDFERSNSYVSLVLKFVHLSTQSVKKN